jgi:hypothetical protein
MEIERMLDSARREASIRRSIYPRFVLQGRLTEQNADRELRAMEEIETVLRVAAECFDTSSELLEAIKAQGVQRE